MNMCPVHWAQLSEALRSHGVSLLVKDREIRQRDKLNVSPITEFDVTAAALLMITKSALHMEGVRWITKQVCPICELGTEHWIDLAARKAVEELSHLPSLLNVTNHE